MQRCPGDVVSRPTFPATTGWWEYMPWTGHVGKNGDGFMQFSVMWSDILSDKLSLRCIPCISSGTYWGGGLSLSLTHLNRWWVSSEWHVLQVYPACLETTGWDAEKSRDAKCVGGSQVVVKLLMAWHQQLLKCMVDGDVGSFCWLMVDRDMVDFWWLMCCPLTPLFSNHYPHFFSESKYIISFGKGEQKMEVSKNKVHPPFAKADLWLCTWLL